ncbi:MAG: mechanosensitive ion channel family protein [Candidatus Entotheonellia bacterium]
MKTLVLFLAVGLLLGCALSPAWGQPHHPEAVGAQGHQSSGQPREVASDVPVDDLDRGTPRRAVEGFLRAARAHNYQRAAKYLDLRRFPSGEAEIRGPQLARHLKIVLDQKLPIDVESVSDSPAGHLEDGLPPDVEQVGRIETPGTPVHIRLQRGPREDGVNIWKISAASVAAIPDLYERYGYGLRGEVLPRVFLETEFLDTQLWQWLALPILVGVGYGLGLLVTTLGFGLVRRWRSEPASVLSTFVAGPVRLLILVLFLSLARRPLQLSLTVSRVLDAVEQILLIIAITWTILRVVESFEAIVRSHALRRDKTSLLPLLPVVRKSVKILIATFAGVAVLHSFGVNVIAVLAGLGVGGIAVALAAQKTLENFIGGITLYADQPVRVGEFCRFGGTVGTVEEVGLRSTRVRTLDRTVVTIPNSEFSNLQIENFARRDRIWYHPTICLRYETTPDQIRYILVEVHRLLYAHPKVDSASARIRFVSFGSSSLDLEVFSYVTVSDFGEYLEVAEDLNLRIMDIVAAAGASLAFPSQTMYVEDGRGLDPDRARAAEAQVQEWRARRELWLPRVPREKIAEIENTLEYPPDGSATGTGGGRR